MSNQNPNRFPKNAPGPFYTVGYKGSDGTWCGECLFCEAPEGEAPELLAPLENGNLDTYFIRQPETALEQGRACNAIGVCCVHALRYGGTETQIIERLGNTAEYCDYILIKGRPVFVGDYPRFSRWKKLLTKLRILLHHLRG